MAFTFDSAEVDPDQLGKGSAAFVTKTGRCRLCLVEFKEYGDTKNGRHILKYEVIAHEHDDQVACVITEFLSNPSPSHSDGGDTARHILLDRAYAFGLLSDEIVRKLKSEGKPIGFDLDEAVGRLCFANLILAKEFQSERRIEVRSTLHINNPKAEKYPRNAGMLAKANRGEGSNHPSVKDSNGSNDEGGNKEATSMDDPFAAAI